MNTLIISNTDEFIRLRIIYNYLKNNTDAHSNKIVTFEDIQNYLNNLNKNRVKNGGRPIRFSRATLFRDLKKLKDVAEIELKSNEHYDEEYYEYNERPPKGYMLLDSYYSPFVETLPVTTEQFQAINNLKKFAKDNKDKQLSEDLIRLQEILEKFSD